MLVMLKKMRMMSKKMLVMLLKMTMVVSMTVERP